jgi:hypothetical protein
MGPVFEKKCHELGINSSWVLNPSVNPNYGKGRSNRPITGSRIVQADLVGPIEIPLI